MIRVIYQRGSVLGMERLDPSAYLKGSNYEPKLIVGYADEQPLLNAPGEVFALRKLLPSSSVTTLTFMEPHLWLEYGTSGLLRHVLKPKDQVWHGFFVIVFTSRFEDVRLTAESRHLDYKAEAHMASVNICVVHKKVAQLCSGQLDEWVLASVGSIYSIGGSYTYVGCSKPVYGASSSQSWLCRKKLRKDDTFPEECLNHGYKHDGKCCSLEEGIMCYRFSIRLVDQSGELEALIWASTLHLLSVPPEEFHAMTTTQHDEVFQGLQGREWRFNVLSVVDQLGFRQFKVQFILPTEKSYVLKSYKPSVEMTDLSRMACLTLPTYPRSSVDPQGRHGFSKASTTLAHKWMTEVESEVAPSIEREIPPQIVEKEGPSQDISYLLTCLESLVAASQQNTRAIEQLALAVKEMQKKE